MSRKRAPPQALEDDSALASPQGSSTTSKRARLVAPSRGRVSTSDSSTENRAPAASSSDEDEDDAAMEEDESEDEMLRSGKQKGVVVESEDEDELALDDEEYERRAAEEWAREQTDVIGEIAQHGIVEEITFVDDLIGD